MKELGWGAIVFRMAAAAALSLCILTSAAEASPVLLDGSASYKLGRQVDILEDPGGALTIADVSSPAFQSRFHPSGKDSLYFGFTTSAIWFRVPVNNPAAVPFDMLLGTDFTHLDHVSFYAPRPEGGFAERKAGLVEVAEKSAIAGQSFIFPFNAGPGETAVYLRVKTDTTFMTPFILWDENAFHDRQKIEWLLYGLNFGVLFAVLCYNLFMFISLKEKSSIVYVLYLSSWIFENLVFNGFAHAYLWTDSLWWSKHSILFAVMYVESTGIIFTRVFLNSRVTAPRVDRLMIGYLWACGAMTLLSLTWPNYTQLHMIIVCTALVYPPLLAAAGITALRGGLRAARFFLLAWVSSIVGIVVYGLVHLGVIPFSALSGHAMDIGVCIEAILMSVAISEAIKDKTAAIRREKEAAQAHALANEMRVHQVLQEAKEQLEVKVEERTTALRMEKERAEDATKIKNKFITLVSHDLRGPLGSVMGLLGMLEQKETYHLDESKQADLVTKAGKSLGGLVEMIDQLLDLSRLQTGRISVMKRPVPVRDMVISSFGHYAPLAEKKGVRLLNEIPPGMKLFADGALISEVLNNLVSNAVKFCRKGDAITIAAPDSHTITVKDGGTGISASILPDLFKPEVKTTTIGTEGEKGTGLGLPYCHEIMVAHGGDLTVESVEGRGAIFSMCFPPVRPVVLIADDQEVQRAIMKKHILEIKDVEVVEASNGLEALEILKTSEVLLLITDLGMPKMDGFELLKEIRGNPLLQTLPVIVNSAISSSTGISGELIDIRRKVFELGANDFIAKPIVPEDFIPRVTRYLG